MEKTYQDKRLTAKSFEKYLAKNTLEEAEELLIKLDSLYSSFDYIKLSIASSDRIISWSMREIEVNLGNRFEINLVKRKVGEVTNNETVKFTDFTPIPGGLFCEKIFGPLKTGVCSCGNRYEKIGFGLACPRCYVEFTESRVRRYRMGVFPLFVPASHVWFLKGRPSYVEQILGIPKKALETTLYYKELFHAFEFSQLSLKEKSLLYPMYFYSQPLKTHPKLCVEFCFFSSIFSNYRREYLQDFQKFLVLSYSNVLEKQTSLALITQKFSAKSQTEIDTFIKRRLPSLKKKSLKLLNQIERLIDFLNEYQNSRPDYYNFNTFDAKVSQDFELYYKFLTKKRLGFLNQFSRQNLFTIFSRAIRIQNKLFPSYTKNILKEKYYEKLGRAILADYYIKKYSGKYRKRYNSEIVYVLLQNIDIKNEIAILRDKLSIATEKKIEVAKTIKRLRVLESFLATNTSPTSLMLTHLPILPPTLRPLQELENGKLISADLNEVYRLIILRTRRIFAYNIFGSKNDEFSLFRSQIAKSVQEAIDCLIDNARMPKRRQMLLNNRPLKTLTEILEGKEGRFRQTLLGKRVDYSGRSVIVVGPELKLNQCGLPFEMAKVLFEPFLIALLLELKTELEQKRNSNGGHKVSLEIYKGLSYKRFLRMLIQKDKPLIWSLLFQLSQEYSILLNRAPTLHKFGVQAFDPLIVLGEAIQLHPLVCPGFNADFDGDQMAVHLPLYYSSQLEIKSFLKSSSNVFSPSNGEVILKPSQDIVIGTYYLTFMNEKIKENFPKIFGNKKEVIMALALKRIELQTSIFVRYSLLKFSFFIEKNQLIFSEDHFTLWKEKVQILKILKSGKSDNKVYLLTNKGILVGKKIDINKYILLECFFETTAGRILFGLGIHNAYK